VLHFVESLLPAIIATFEWKVAALCAGLDEIHGILNILWRIDEQARVLKRRGDAVDQVHYPAAPETLSGIVDVCQQNLVESLFLNKLLAGVVDGELGAGGAEDVCYCWCVHFIPRLIR
tara:strand:- start:4732 stop:5085 length:354 start_codon:yes stop_codon:yes gene_type:complete